MIDTIEIKNPKPSYRTLKILATLLWLMGGVMLIRKAGELFIEAYALEPTSLWIWFAFSFGITLGGVKAKYLFNKACKKNLIRIDQLESPKLWQFYRPGFFLFLALMIRLGTMLSNLAHNNYPFLLSVAVLDTSLATALLASSIVFWQEKAFVKN